MRKQFKLNVAVGVTANIARLRGHIIRNMKKHYRPMGRLGRMIAHRRLGCRMRRGLRTR